MWLNQKEGWGKRVIKRGGGGLSSRGEKGGDRLIKGVGKGGYSGGGRFKLKKGKKSNTQKEEWVSRVKGLL